MLAFAALVNQVLSFVPKPLRDRLLSLAKKQGKKIESKKIARIYAQHLLNGANSVVIAAAKSLIHRNASGEFVGDDEVNAIVAAYLQQTRQEATAIAQAIANYLPKQIAYQTALAKFGADSEQTKTARADKKAYLHTARQELRDLVQALSTGDEDDD